MYIIESSKKKKLTCIIVECRKYNKITSISLLYGITFVRNAGVLTVTIPCSGSNLICMHYIWRVSSGVNI